MSQKNQIRIAEAVDAIQSRNFLKAEKILKNVLQQEPVNIRALEILGLVFASQGSHSEAVKHLTKATR